MDGDVIEYIFEVCRYTGTVIDEEERKRSMSYRICSSQMPFHMGDLVWNREEAVS